MIFETNIVYWFVAIVVGYILSFIQPFVTPIGEVMVLWVSYLLDYFPYGNYTLYIAIFIILVVAGVIINASIIGRVLKEKVEEIEDIILGKDEESKDKQVGKEVKEEDKNLEEEELEELEDNSEDEPEDDSED